MSIKSVLKSKRFHSILGIIVSVIFLLGAFKSVDWQAVAVYLRNISYWGFIPSIIALAIHYWFRALRWRYLLPGGEKIRTLDLFDSIMVGNFGTYVLPLRAGEFIRPFLITKRSDLSFPSAFVSVVIERFFDLAAVLGFFAVLVTVSPNLPEWTNTATYPLSLLAIGLFTFILVSAFLPRQLQYLVSVFSNLLPDSIRSAVQKFLSDFLAGALVLKSPSKLALVCFYTLAVWAMNLVIFYVYFWIFDMPASWSVSLALVVLVALAVAAPSAPGFVGVYQIGCAAAFLMYGLDQNSAAAYSIVTHVLQFLIFIVYGLWVLSKYRLRLNELKEN